ncbi:hypothetical protein AOH205_08620 [Helicobacter pylori]
MVFSDFFADFFHHYFKISNEALALEIDACIRDNKKDGWVGHNQKEKNLKIALRKIINDEGLLENTFNLAKHIDEYH